MKDLHCLDEYRIPYPIPFGELPEEMKSGNGFFGFDINGEEYYVMASDGMEWDHVSVSHENKIPSWEVMCKIKDMFFGKDEVVMQLHPRESEYINNCETCLHLWRPQKLVIPTPPSIMVGLKEEK